MRIGKVTVNKIDERDCYFMWPKFGLVSQKSLIMLDWELTAKTYAVNGHMAVLSPVTFAHRRVGPCVYLVRDG